jgi:coproporphyrinogen III oxidase
MAKFNPLQAKIAELYANGEYFYIADTNDVRGVGDTLFTLLIREADDPEDMEEFVGRLDTIIDDVMALKAALPEEMPT